MLWALGISKSGMQSNAMTFFSSITGILGQILQKSWALKVVFFQLVFFLILFLKSLLLIAGRAALFSKPPLGDPLKISMSFHSADCSVGCWIPSAQLCLSGCAGVSSHHDLGFSSIHFAHQTRPGCCQLSLKSTRASCCQLFPHILWCQNYRIILISRVTWDHPFSQIKCLVFP